MISIERIISSRKASTSVCAAIFALGLATGAALGPVTASRGGSVDDRQSVPSSAISGASLLRAAHPAEVLRVIDGDTFEARVRVWPGIEITTKIRLRGIDAPELTRARCQEERDRAIAARDALAAILDQGDVGVSRVALDKYGGHVLADAWTRATPDISAALLNAGLARSYSGGRRDSWC
jgi:endonuclease YncB( thermonuclease family)